MKYTFDVQKAKVKNHEFYVVESKCLKGCVAQGDTLDEALELFAELEAECIETAKKYGIQIFSEQIKEDMDYSGKLTLRLPKFLHKEVAEVSKADGISLNQFMVNALCRELGYRQGTKDGNNSNTAMEMLNAYKTCGNSRGLRHSVIEKFKDYSYINRGIAYDN